MDHGRRDIVAARFGTLRLVGKFNRQGKQIDLDAQLLHGQAE